MKHWLLLILTLNAITVSAQFKYEKESEISTEDVPVNALSFFTEKPVIEKIYWYKEQSLDRISYEAKFRLNKQQFSIEFDSIGRVEDIEVLRSWKKIPRKVRATISEYFDQNSQKWKLERLQAQYSGSLTTLNDFLNTQLPAKELKERFEIVAKIKRNGSFKMMEFLFDANGEFIYSNQIILEHIDNLEF